jgi:hypothetical protein
VDGLAVPGGDVHLGFHIGSVFQIVVKQILSRVLVSLAFEKIDDSLTDELV